MRVRGVGGVGGREGVEEGYSRWVFGSGDIRWVQGLAGEGER